MKFAVTRTSVWKWDGTTVEINTPDDLLALAAKEGHELIVKRRSPEPGCDMPEIEIYDGYRE